MGRVKTEMKKYIVPEIEIIAFNEINGIICTSGSSEDQFNGTGFISGSNINWSIPE